MAFDLEGFKKQTEEIIQAREAEKAQANKGFLGKAYDVAADTISGAAALMERDNEIEIPDVTKVDTFEDHSIPGLTENIAGSRTAYNYWLNDEEKLARANKIQEATGVSAEAVMQDAEAWHGANRIYEFMKDDDNLQPKKKANWTVEDTLNHYPEIKKIAEKDPVQGALALKNLKYIRRELDTFDSFYKHYEIGQKQFELNNLLYKQATKTANGDDLTRIDQLKEEVAKESAAYALTFKERPIDYALSGVAQSLPEMLASIREGAEDAAIGWQMGLWAGAGIGSAIPGAGTAAGAAAGSTAGGIVGAVKGITKAIASKQLRNEMIKRAANKAAVNVMTTPMAARVMPTIMKVATEGGTVASMARSRSGEKFDEYSNWLDENGDKLLTEEEAWNKAQQAGIVNALLENLPTFEAMGSLIKPSAQAEKVIESILARGTAKAGVQQGAKQAAIKAVKNAAKITLTESAEEATQTAADDIIENSIKLKTGGYAYEETPAGFERMDRKNGWEILKDSAVSFFESLPSSFVFGLGGSLGAGAVQGGRYVARQNQLRQIEEQYGKLAQQTYIGTMMAEQLQQAAHDDNLRKIAPEIQKNIIKEKAAGTGFEIMYVDTEMALQKEGGRKDLEALAKSVGITEEELETAISMNGTIAAPLECFAQSEASGEILDSASFTPEAESIARMKKNAQDVIAQMKENMDKLAKNQVEMVNSIAGELFKGDTEEDRTKRNLAAATVFQNPANPAEGLKELITQKDAELKEILQGAFDWLVDTHGNGTTLIPIDDDGRSIRVSENAQWYQDWYKEHKRKPTKQELWNLAEDMVTGKKDTEYLHFDSREAMEEAMETEREIAGIKKELSDLESIKEKMSMLDGAEMKLTEGLSPEAYKVYRAVYEQLQNAPGKAGRAAKMGAVLFARHADLYAKAMQERGNKNFTAADYMNLVGIRYGMNPAAAVFNQTGVNKKRLQVPAIDQSKKIQKPIKTVLDEFTRKYPDGRVANTSIGQVIINKKGIQSSLSHGISDKKLAVIDTLKDGIEQADLVRTMSDYNDIRKTYHYFVYSVDIGGEENFVLCRVVEQYGNKKLYIHEVASREEIKGKKSNSLQTRADTIAGEKAPRGIALYVQILSEYLNNVKDREADQQFNQAVITQSDEVRRQYEGTDKWIKAPNGETTNLTEDQWLAVRTPAFKAWFGDWENDPENASKVLDKNGEPKVMYHQTKNTFNTYDIKTEKGGGADDFLTTFGVFTKPDKSDLGMGDIQMPLFVKVVNPISFQDREEVEKWGRENILGFDEKLNAISAIDDEYQRKYDEADRKVDEQYAALWKKRRAKEITEEEYQKAIEIGGKKTQAILDEWGQKINEASAEAKTLLDGYLREQGYDGMYLKEDKGSWGRWVETTVGFNPNQIKSATNNNGNFSTTDDNIYYQAAYHGSPYDFDRFDLGAIGTGEGAQAHGWGLYFAKDREVSEAYKNILSKAKSAVYYDGKKYSVNEDGRYENDGTGEVVTISSPLERAFDYIVRAGGNLKEALSDYQSQNDSIIKAYERIKEKFPDVYAAKLKEHKAVKDILTSQDKWVIERDGGKLYEVEVPDNKYLLDEQLTYKDQKKTVQKNFVEAISSLPDEQKQTFWKELLKSKLGRSSDAALKAFAAHQDINLLVSAFDVSEKDFSFLKKSRERKLKQHGYTDEEIKSFMADKDLAAVEKEKFLPELKRLETELEAARQKDEERDQALIDEAIADPDKWLTVYTGSRLYDALDHVLGFKGASLYLNDHGIKGITYEGGRDGRCFVVFDDKAVSIIEKYNQEIKGSIAREADGRRVISLFETANESTFIHESGHLFLMDLEELAKTGGQYAKDWQTVMEWASYKNGDEALYKDSPFEKEFEILAGQIRTAEEQGDNVTAEKLKRRWYHERFARGFEAYLKEGTAPTSALKAVFRKLKDFLKTIYNAVISTGVRATPEVEAVMARMIAADEEIEAVALDDRFKDINKAGGEKLLTETEAETYQRWQQEAKEEAKEKLLKILMKDLKKENRRRYEEAIAEERERMAKELAQEPVYLAARIIKETGDENAPVALGIYGDIEDYKNDRAAAESIGEGTEEEALENYMKSYAEEKDKEIIQSHTDEEELAARLESEPYHQKRLALEAEAMKNKQLAMGRINNQAEAALGEIEKLADEMPETGWKKEALEAAKKQIANAASKLRFSRRWTPAELKAIDRIVNADSRKELRQALQQFREKAQDWKSNLKGVQQAFNSRIKEINKAAEESLALRSVADACNVAIYAREEQQAAKKVDAMVHAARWNDALKWQERRLVAAAMVRAARQNKEHVERLVDRIEKQLSVKSVKLPAQERYWHRQLGYLLRLIKQPPIMPENCPRLADIFSGLNESLDVEFDAGEIYDIMSRENFAGYKSLTVAQLEDAADIMTVLYKTGRDKFKLKTVDGMLVSDVVDEILNDKDAVINYKNGPRVKQSKVWEDTGGLGYNDLVAKVPVIGEIMSRCGQRKIQLLFQPETIIEQLGKTAQKYIYGIYEKAMSDEGRRTAKSVVDLRNIMSVYSNEEKLEMKKQKYEFYAPASGVQEKMSKENIICMALNMGNETNWMRLCKGILPMSDGDNPFIRSFIEENMEKKDWEVVQKIWDYIDSFWPDTVKVEEELNGVTLKKVPARAFNVKCEGEQLSMRGGYYPVVYNPTKSLVAEDQSIDEAAKRTMSGAQVLGTGRGFTKARSEAKNIARPLRLSLDVVPEHVQSVIHNISFRIAARDVYRILHDSRLQNKINATLGRGTMRVLNDWAVDCWRIMPDTISQASGEIGNTLASLRKNSAMAIMGYRVRPAIENVSNFGPMMDYLGGAEALSAVFDYLHKEHVSLHNLSLSNEYDDLLAKSVFMSNRINNMDRDIKQQPNIFHGGLPIAGYLKEHAYDFMVFTDLMLSKPLWVRVFKNNLAENYRKVAEENQKQLKRFADAQAKAKAAKAMLLNLRSEKNKLQEAMMEEEFESNYTPEALNGVVDKAARIKKIENLETSVSRELWEAERDMDLLESVSAMTPDDILQEAEQLSVQDADAAVRNVFGSGQTKDLSPLQKGGELAKLFTSFSGYFITQLNAVFRAYYKGRFTKEYPIGMQQITRWMPLVKVYLYRYALTTVITSMMLRLLFGEGDDDKDKYRTEIDEKGNKKKVEVDWLTRTLKQYGKNLIATTFGGLIGLREIVALASNYFIDGKVYGNGLGYGSVQQYFFERAGKMIDLAWNMNEHNAEIDAKEAKARARYRKMSPEAKREYRKKLKYKKPEKRITGLDIAQAGLGIVPALTAASTGITDTMVNAVMTTMQYMFDGDGRYDRSLYNMAISAIFNRRPAEREIPKKPEKKKKQKGESR